MRGPRHVVTSFEHLEAHHVVKDGSVWWKPCHYTFWLVVPLGGRTIEDTLFSIREMDSFIETFWDGTALVPGYKFKLKWEDRRV